MQSVILMGKTFITISRVPFEIDLMSSANFLFRLSTVERFVLTILLFRDPRRKKSGTVRSGDLGGHGLTFKSPF